MNNYRFIRIYLERMSEDATHVRHTRGVPKCGKTWKEEKRAFRTLNTTKALNTSWKTKMEHKVDKLATQVRP